MYTMKDVCQQCNLPYETLKYYCNEGLIPNVKRDEHNYRIFDERDVEWLRNLNCLKQCGMKISEMKEYVALCLEGESTILKRKEILAKKKQSLEVQLEELNACMNYIDTKQQFYDDVLQKKIKYTSNLINVDK